MLWLATLRVTFRGCAVSEVRNNCVVVRCDDIHYDPVWSERQVGFVPWGESTVKSTYRYTALKARPWRLLLKGSASVPAGLGVRQGVVVIGVLVAVVAGIVFRLRLLVVAVFAVVDGLQEARLVLLHHVSGGAAAGQRSRCCQTDSK